MEDGHGDRLGKPALLLNGGGISAAAWEVGCLAALDKAFGTGFCARTFEIYVGVSAGAVIAALAANGVLPGTLRHEIINDRDGSFNFRRTDVYQIEYTRILSRCWDALKRLRGVIFDLRRQGIDFTVFDLLDVLQELLPAGFFSLDPFQRYLDQMLRSEGLSDDFTALQRELYIPAIDLDRGARIVFGETGHEDVRISQAITASCAIPAFFLPYRVKGRSFIDGAMGGHCHIDVALKHGATLLVVINPLVPIHCDPEREMLPALSTRTPRRSVADLGISFVGDQALRILSHERLAVSLELSRQANPDVEILVLEPSREDPFMFVNGPMSFQARGRILEHGYDTTLRDIEENREEYTALFERHTGYVPTRDVPPRAPTSTHVGASTDAPEAPLR